MIAPSCNIYNGAVCCAKKCPVLPQLASEMRWKMTVCPGGLQLSADDDQCVMPSPNCVQGNDFCDANTTCHDEEANTYFQGATWSVGDCITCNCSKGVISCSRTIKLITSSDKNIEHCSQPGCNVLAFQKSNKGICKACIWKNQTLRDGHQWTENGVHFFCSSGQQRVKRGCYLDFSEVRCTGAFEYKTWTLISDERLYLCESGDEIRSLNDRCNKIKDCYDNSDERECAQYFCPFHTKFNLYWERTAVNKIVQRNCSDVDPNLGGHFTSRCSSGTQWNHRERCYCEKETLRQEFMFKGTSQLWSLRLGVKDFACGAPNYTHTFCVLFGHPATARVSKATPLSILTLHHAAPHHATAHQTVPHSKATP
ncbi:hypothetical protein OS493_030641 [Desmophyllum pertusum]|uniref:Uncharacterized protein n=1 Tax=Desmophyllum pertusum TaxID=174260 RepID=A0A9X0D1D8_9CNID|nr:hypothetical protein OS493_030641 [Desmophyllum pertusum]